MHTFLARSWYCISLQLFKSCSCRHSDTNTTTYCHLPSTTSHSLISHILSPWKMSLKIGAANLSNTFEPFHFSRWLYNYNIKTWTNSTTIRRRAATAGTCGQNLGCPQLFTETSLASCNKGRAQVSCVELGNKCKIILTGVTLWQHRTGQWKPNVNAPNVLVDSRPHSTSVLAREVNKTKQKKPFIFPLRVSAFS